MKIVYEIPDEAIELLKKIKSAGIIEFRDSQYKNIDEYKKSSSFGTSLGDDKIRDEAYFFKRNFCNQDELTALIVHELIEDVEMAWHLTYRISDKGNSLLSKLTDGVKEIQM